MGQKPKNYRLDTVLKAIAGSGGITSHVAKKLKCDWATARTYIDKYPEAIQAMEDEQEVINDVAENQLIKQIQKGEQWAVKFRLTTKAKNRGYAETQHIEHSGNIKLEDFFKK